MNYPKTSKLCCLFLDNSFLRFLNIEEIFLPTILVNGQFETLIVLILVRNTHTTVSDVHHCSRFKFASLQNFSTLWDLMKIPHTTKSSKQSCRSFQHNNWMKLDQVHAKVFITTVVFCSNFCKLLKIYLPHHGKGSNDVEKDWNSDTC